MRAVVAVLAALVALACAGAAGAATRTYASGLLGLAVADGATVEHAIDVPDPGPVAHAAVSVRIDHPRTPDLTLTLVSPSGRTVVLAARRGTGRNFGRGARCDDVPAVFDDDGFPVAEAEAPFTEEPLRPEGRLASLRGEEARGRWTLRVRDHGGGSGGTLVCWRLELARDVVEIRRARLGAVTALVSFREVRDVYRDVRVRIVRGGRTALNASLSGGYPGWRPVLPPVVRRLDGDREPEVVLDVYTGGAHCCTVSRIYRWLPDARRYTAMVHDWGNAGYRLRDLDRDGRPELVSGDDRFSSAFTAYAASVRPLRVWRLERGRLADVTRRFPGAVRADAAATWRTYQAWRRRRLDVRGVLAAWAADQHLLGRGRAAWRTLEAAARRGELGRGRAQAGYPAGRAYLNRLRVSLRRWGYAR